MANTPDKIDIADGLSDGPHLVPNSEFLCHRVEVRTADGQTLYCADLAQIYLHNQLFGAPALVIRLTPGSNIVMGDRYGK